MEGSRDLEKYILAILETVFPVEPLFGRENRFRWNVTCDLTLELQLENYNLKTTTWKLHSQYVGGCIFNVMDIYLFILYTCVSC